tara:strand:+ start:94 stop:315 length:222 start_codon:yes stop_codon:yes gene_type:complete
MNSPHEQALEKARKHLHNAYMQLFTAYTTGEYAADIGNALIDTQRAQSHMRESWMYGSGVPSVDVVPDYKHIH